jgi:glycerol-3-phosphate O-acyltransferase
MSEAAEIVSEKPSPPETPLPPHRSAMRARFGWFAERIARYLFGHVVMNAAAVEKIRELSTSGTVVYAMRHRSFVDFFLINYVLRREGLPLPVFANGVSSTLLAPTKDLFARLMGKLYEFAGRSASEAPTAQYDYCARAAAAGKPVLIFMRGRRSAGTLAGWFRRGAPARVGTDFFREVVHSYPQSGNEYYIIPMALFLGHSFRKRETGISALVYSVQDVPSDARKLFAYWWNRKDLFITVGAEVTLGDFLTRYASDSRERIVRRLTRAIQIFLHREERVVLGPALLPRKQVKSLVLDNDEMTAAIERLSEEGNVPVAKLRKEADGYFEEMAADFNGIKFAVVAYVFKKIWARMFSGIVPMGFEQVVDKVRHHPVVLVPCHRSHFDYLILTYLCHLNFVSPPHIFAGVNMAFWPLAPLLRASGAYFVRRTFSDNELYKLVFREYLSFLVREGYTQEFFIEGGRSRTGKMMTPKLGMLSAVVNTYLSGVRRDLYLAPVSIHYGRILEEDAYQFELSGGEKEKESFSGLLRARRFLQQRYGTVYLSFAKPISLQEVLGDDRQRLAEGLDDPDIEEEKRRLVQKLGFKILRDVNDCSVAGATSISASVLLGGPYRGTHYEEYAEQANALASYVKAAGIVTTASLERNLGDFRESVEFLTKSGLIEILRRGPDEILVVKENKRLALDFYKNNLIHAYLLGSLVAGGMSAGKRGTELVDEVWEWLDFFRWEFPLPPREEIGSLVDAEIRRFEQLGVWKAGSFDADHALVRALIAIMDVFREAYFVAARSVRDVIPEEGMPEKAFTAEYRKGYEASILVGDAAKSEGATTMMLQNALSKYGELGYVRLEKAGRGGRETKVFPGPDRADIETTIERLSATIGNGRKESRSPENATDERGTNT